MANGVHSRQAAVAMILIFTGLLAGCTTQGEGVSASNEYASASLAETKSPVQLLRNSAAGRIAPDVVSDEIQTTDSSVACLDAADDPDGKLRHWLSVAEIEVVRWHVWRVDEITGILIRTFIEQGWRTSQVDGEHGGTATLIENNESVATITIETVGADDDSAATIYISTNGPCVATDGAESEEVAALETPE